MFCSFCFTLQLSEKAVILYEKEYYFIKFHSVLLNLGTNLNNEQAERKKLQSTYK